MSKKSRAAGRSHRWATRRALGAILGAAVVVGTAATAQASGHGNDFFGSHHTSVPAARTMANDSVSHRTTQDRARCTNGWTGPGTTYDSSAQDSTGHAMQQDHGDMQGWTWVGDQTSGYAFRTVGDQADPTFNQLLGVNDCGTIVGYFGSGADAAHPNKGYRVAPPYGRHSFKGENYPGSVQTQVVGVNDDGTTVGFYIDREGDNHGFFYRDGAYHTVIFPGTTSKPSFNQLLGVNQRGIAAGFWNDKAGMAHGYLFNTWTGHFTPVSLPVHADSVTVTGVNDHGKVVGFYVDGKNTHGFVWTRHSFETVRLGNDTNTQVLGINDDGDIVGSFGDGHATTHGFIRSDMKVWTVDAPGSTSTVINGLNGKGQVVGFYEDQHKNTKGFTAHQ